MYRRTQGTDKPPEAIYEALFRLRVVHMGKHIGLQGQKQSHLFPSLSVFLSSLWLLDAESWRFRVKRPNMRAFFLAGNGS